ncbi:FliM/FliN family flagellar motor switch protein [Cognatiyoonia sp. IB215446]|uniref:FliM/FliN family flagellar motor switch protein n=1 Tax=Cognatiyoonia sp. IB215446 TaxID=3097355 RepID=UPI002A10253D|nr:FliM/FliN family flagellar motor switch protein [Cognatiyoonia sp. IB215446]MDX8347781.1 FliM/FliN family flagellar motor switch protein [Cognatiyoonia sp. IB215446]
MADQQHTHILRRMAGQPQTDVADSPLTSSRAVRIALTKVAQDSVGLTITVQAIEEETLPLDDLLTGLSDELMLVGVHRGGDLAGLLGVDMQLRAAVVEMQTAQIIGEKPAEFRNATKTDKRMCDPLLVSLLKALPHAVVGTEFSGWLDGTTSGDLLPSARAAGLLLRDQSYRIVRMRVSLGTGEREGMIALALPVATDDAAQHATAEPVADWPKLFRATVSDAPAAFDAELCRFQMPIGQAENLAIGDLIPLPGCTVASVKLRSLDGVSVRHARLGQSNGKRAVRIAAAPVSDMHELSAASVGMQADQPPDFAADIASEDALLAAPTDAAMDLGSELDDALEDTEMPEMAMTALDEGDELDFAPAEASMIDIAG